ncbi:hypothetical protein ES705_13976 [subsurface metagenome]
MAISYFCVTATGRTYPVRHQLRGWGFHWDTHLRAWINPSVDAWRVSDFRKLISSGIWRGVKLSLENHQDLQT